MSDKAVKFVLSAQDRTAQALNGLRSNLGRVEGAVTTVNEGLGRLGVVFGGAFAAGTLTAFITGVNNGVDKLNDLKDATGSSIANISALEDIGARTGTSFDTVSQSLVKFNQILGDATPGSKQAEILKSIGLNAEELKRIDPAEALRQTAVALAGYADNGQKARLTQELFGKSLREVAPFLNDLAEKTQLVGTVTEEQARQAEAFNKQLAQLQKNSLDAARSLVADLVPALNAVLQQFRDKGLNAAIDEFDRRLMPNFYGEQRRRQIKALTDDLEELRRQRASMKDDLLGALKQSLGGSSPEELDQLILKREQQLQKLKGLVFDSQAGAGRGSVNPAFTPGENRPSAPAVPTPKPTAKEEIDKDQRAIDNYIASQRKEQDNLRQLSEEQKALNFLRTLGANFENTESGKRLLELAAQNDALAEQAELRKLNTEAARALAEQERALNDAIDEYSGRTGDARKQALTARLEARMASGEVFSPEELERIVKGIGGITDEIDKSKSAAEELGLTFSSAFEEAVLGGQNLRQVLAGLSQDVARIVLRKSVTEPLAGSLTSLLKSFLPGFATGLDYVPYDDFPAMLHKGERVLTAEEARSGAANSSPYFDMRVGSIVISGNGVTHAEVAKAFQAFGAAQEAKFNRKLRRGGVA